MKNKNAYLVIQQLELKLFHYSFIISIMNFFYIWADGANVVFSPPFVDKPHPEKILHHFNGFSL